MYTLVNYVNILTQCNKQCDQDHWYTYISHYLHMSLTNMPVIMYKYVPLHLYCSLHIDSILLHMQVKENQPATLITIILVYMGQ